MSEKEDFGCKVFTKEEIEKRLRDAGWTGFEREDYSEPTADEDAAGVICCVWDSLSDHKFYAQATPTKMRIRRKSHRGQELIPWLPIEDALALIPLL